jgi:putative ATPase
MKELGYGDGYRYAHDYETPWVSGTSAGRAAGKRFYDPTDRGYER